MGSTCNELGSKQSDAEEAEPLEVTVARYKNEIPEFSALQCDEN